MSLRPPPLQPPVNAASREFSRTLLETLCDKLGLDPADRWKLALYIGVPTATLLSFAAYWYFTDDESETSTSTTESKKTALESPAETLKSIVVALKDKGNACFKKKEYHKAIQEYTAAIESAGKELNSDRAIFYQNRAAAFEKLDDIESALTDLNESIILNRSYAKAYSRRASIYRLKEEFEKALFDFTASCIIQDFKDHNSITAADEMLKQVAKEKAESRQVAPGTLRHSRQLLVQFSDNFVTDPVFQYFGTHSNDLPDSYRDDEDFMAAMKALQKYNFDTALTACESCVEKQGKRVSEALLLQATLLAYLGKKDESDAALQQIFSAESTPRSLRLYAHLYRAHFLSNAGKYDESIKELTKCAQMESDNPDVHFGRAQIELVNEKVENALKSYEECLQHYPTHGIARSRKLVLEYMAAGAVGNFPMLMQLVVQMEQLAKDQPECNEAQLVFAQALTDQGKVGEAKDVYERLKAKDSDNVSLMVQEALLLIQTAGEQKSQLDAAEKILDKVIATDDQFSLGYETLASLYMSRGSDGIENAVALYEKAAEVARSSQEYARVLSMLLAARVQYNVAKQLGRELPSN